MDQEHAISLATKVANKHGVMLGPIVLCGLVGTDELLTESVRKHRGPLFGLGKWYLIFGPINGGLDGQNEFLVDDRTGGVEWREMPWWLRIMMRVAAWRRKKSQNSD